MSIYGVCCRSLNKTAGLADWQGAVRDVPSLGAPGFAIALTGGQMGGMFGSFPDVSAQVMREVTCVSAQMGGGMFGSFLQKWLCSFP